MKPIVQFLILFFANFVVAQESTLSVKYSFYHSDSETQKGEFAYLTNSKNKSLFIMKTKKIDAKTRYFDENNKMQGDLVNTNDVIFKDFNENRFYSKSPVNGTKKLILKDSLNNLDWKITDLKKDILGYNCTEAKTSYHGRNYIAFFTEKIPIFDGPWKFSGLPGLILELKEESGMLEIIAFELNIENKLSELSTTLDIKNSFYWTELIDKAIFKKNELDNEFKIKYNIISSNIDTSSQLELYNLNK